MRGIIEVSEKVKKLSDSISSNSIKKVEHYFPMDRFFLEKYGYLEAIININAIQFLFYNLEGVSENYSEHLLLCLPELWDKIEYDDIIHLIESFTNSFSFYSLVLFMYKYLEIDILDEIFNNPNVKEKYKQDCIDYFPKIIATYYLDKDDYQMFDENLAGIHLEDWNYNRQRLTLDSRFKKAVDIHLLKKRLTEFEKSISS